MRLRALRLIAFGPFTGRELTLAGDDIPPHALQVVYGANEAGKSTALRAISGLLFGIPVQTRDAHTHRMADLRVGGTLEAADGARLELVRRKGNKNTLLDPAGTVLDEAILQRLCGATTEATFRALFGLDHVSLREGAEALLAGRGDVGESLFDAAVGTGGKGIHRVLQELEAEADALFAPQAQKRKLNEAIRAYHDARTASREKARSGEAWQKQIGGLDEARTERERIVQAMRARKAELHRLERVRRLLPLAAARDRLDERLAALGEVVLLVTDAGREREAALQAHQQAGAEIARLDREIADGTAARDRLVVPPWLDDPAALRLGELPDLLGAHRKAAADRPRLAGELGALEAEAQTMAARVRGDGHEEAPLPALTVAQQPRIRTLGFDEAPLLQALALAGRKLGDLARRRDARAASLAALPPERDAAPLRALLRRVEREREVEARAEALGRERARLLADLGRRAALLGLGPGAADALLGLPVPTPEAVERFAGDLQGLGDREARLQEERAGLQRKRREGERALAELESQGQIPTARALAEARAARDATWAALRAEAAPRTELIARYEQERGRADDVADRLWREADRVARAAALMAEGESGARAEAEAEARAAGLARERARLEGAWQALWTPAGIEARSPAEMRGWLRRFSEAAEVARRLEQAGAELESLDERLRRARAELVAALAPAAPGPDVALGALCDRAAGAAATLEGAARQRAELGRELDALEEELRDTRGEHDGAERALGDWRRRWAEAIAPLGLPPEASAAVATAVLEAAGALARKQEEAAQLRGRIRSIDRDARQFEELVGALVAALAPDLLGRPARDGAEALLGRHRDGLQARRDRGRAEADLGQKEAARRAAELRLAAAAAQLAGLLRAAGVADLDALGAAERRSSEARELHRQLAENEAHVLATGDGLGLRAALAEARGITAEELDAQIDALKEGVDALDVDLQGANQRIGSLTAGLRILDETGGTEAADAAAEAHAHLARVRALAEQYARLRLATRLLAREVERHREQHQGPVLARAGALLGRLTLGRYSGLRADFDESDRPVLRCLRADGTRVPVEGLSDGTRDQLYLSLRLASLERRAASAEPLPLVLDDILIHFDDERATAALGVLADHARSTQVVLFTHHARVVDLAEAALPPERLRIVRWAG